MQKKVFERFESVRELVADARLQSSPMLPILIAARDGDCHLMVIGQDCGPFEILSGGKPWICLIADHVPAPRGPVAFDRRSIDAVFQRASISLIVCEGGVPAVYQACANHAAILRGSVVIISTGVRFEADWLAVSNPARPPLICTPIPDACAQ